MWNMVNNNNKKPVLILSIILPVIVLFLCRFFYPIYLNLYKIQYTLGGSFLLIFVSPILEEIVFRGLLQDFFIKIIRSKVLALGLLNIIFSLIHAHNNQNIVYLSILFFCGIIFSIVKYNYNKLSYVIFLHAYYNILFVIFTIG